MNELSRLENILESMPGLAVAFSGGVDSTLLAYVAHRVLGGKSLAVFVDAPVMHPAERSQAESLAGRLGFALKVAALDWLGDPQLVKNPPDRCYWCKRKMLSIVKEIARAENLPYLADGTNADDHREDRPGLLACQELKVRQPLFEAGLGKREVRALAERLGLPNAQKPASPCLATRFPTGSPVTDVGLERVSRGESALQGLGFGVVRVRDFFPVGVVEVPHKDLAGLCGQREAVIKALQEAGYRRAAIDLEGYKG